MASLKGLILIALAIIQVVQCTTPTIGFISPDIVADIGKDDIFVKKPVWLKFPSFLFKNYYLSVSVVRGIVIG